MANKLGSNRLLYELNSYKDSVKKKAVFEIFDGSVIAPNQNIQFDWIE